MKIGLIKEKIHKILYGKNRRINGTKGVISLFLALLLVPFTTIAGSLVNAARVDSAVAIFDEALCNASNSTLGTYDEFLRKRFGLLAMSQNVTGKADSLNQYTVSDLIAETFDYYLQQNVNALSNTYVASESNATGVYSLADTGVLLYQVLEYSKYTVPTKLVADGLSINDMIKSLEGQMPGKGILDLITAGTGAVESIADLAVDFDKLKTTVKTEENATNEYNNKYRDFNTNVSNYVDKKLEMESELTKIQIEINGIESEISVYSNEINGLNGQAVELNKQITRVNKQISNLEKEKALKEQTKATLEDVEEISKVDTEINILIAEIERLVIDKENLENTFKSINTNISATETNLSAQRTALANTKITYENTKQNYQNQLDEIKQVIDTSKKAYSSAIQTLMECLSSSKDALTTVQNDITGVSSSASDIVTTVTTNTIDKANKENEEKIKELEKKIETAETEKSKEALNQQLVDLKAMETSIDNQETVANALKDGYDSAISSMKNDISTINTERYQNYVNKLAEIKRNIDVYDLSNIEEKLNQNIYYISIADLLTSAEAEEAERNLVNEIASESIWGVLKAFTGFIKALFNISLVYNPDLAAVIDTKYYKDTYGGLPAEKDRIVYPLNNGEVGDEALSEYYKSLFGDYMAGDYDISESMDIWTLLQKIFTNIGIITVNVNKITTGMALLDFSGTLTSLIDAVTELKNCIETAITYLKDALASIGNKMLLSGYVSYMTSNRTTYAGSALNGTSFNYRGQDISTSFSAPTVSDFSALLDTINKTTSGGTEKCFVGAETEYVMFGFPTEIGNQAAAFAATYLVRVLADIVVIVRDPEVASIAAACTIASPIVYIIYIFVEPLVDTLILVNGETVSLIKTYVYLTPTGLESLISKLMSLSLNTQEINQVKISFTEKIGATKYADLQKTFGTSVSSKDSKYFNLDYTQNLFLIMTMFTSREKILDRLSNIIQMETVEYMNNQVITNGLFDLDYSYTYIRAEASFTMNEFIKISETKGLNSQKRIIYRGY